MLYACKCAYSQTFILLHGCRILAYGVPLRTCRSGVPDGQPKLLLSLIPDYPLLNFMLTTSIYIAVSKRYYTSESCQASCVTEAPSFGCLADFLQTIWTDKYTENGISTQ